MSATRDAPNRLRTFEKSLHEVSHPEIQQRACLALSQLMPCLDEAIVQSLAKRFIKLSDTVVRYTHTYTHTRTEDQMLCDVV
jgi:hypothetical protein